jgi:hypothetical protein
VLTEAVDRTFLFLYITYCTFILAQHKPLLLFLLRCIAVYVALITCLSMQSKHHQVLPSRATAGATLLTAAPLVSVVVAYRLCSNFTVLKSLAYCSLLQLQ